MRLHRQLIPLGLLPTVIAIATAAPAGATVIEHAKYSFTEIRKDVVCGVDVVHKNVYSGVAHLRVGTGRTESAFFAFDNYKIVTTLTTADGHVVYIEHDAIWVDTKATRIDGSVFEFTTINAGQPLRIRDSTGRVISRDVGIGRETYLFDTLGDDTPGGTFIEQLEFQVRGNHTLLPATGFDEAAFCAIVRPLLTA